MKPLLIIRSFAVAILLSLPAFAANQPESASSSSPAQTQSPTAASPTVAAAQKNYKDAFLAFALDKAEKYSGAAEQAVSKAVDAATKEAPVLAHEFIVWRAWMHGLKGFTPFILCALAVTLFCKQWGKFEFDRGGNYLTHGASGNVMATVIGGVGTVITFAICCYAGFSNILDFVQVIVAPRVYMVEQVLQLFHP